MEKVFECKELKEILHKLKPMESVWCSELSSEIVMFNTGFSVSLYDVQKDLFISSFFVPNAESK